MSDHFRLNFGTENGPMKVISVVCPRCSENVKLLKRPSVETDNYEILSAMGELLERFHCPTGRIVRKSTSSSSDDFYG